MDKKTKIVLEENQYQLKQNTYANLARKKSANNQYI